MPFTPTFVKQLDGSTCGGSNCNVATHRMAADRHQRGIDPAGDAPWKPSPARLRKRIKAIFDLTGCGGTDNGMNARVLKTDYRIAMEVRFNVPIADYAAAIAAGRAGEATIQYSAMRDTRFDSCPSFKGRHAVFVADRRFLAAGKAFSGSPEGIYWRVGDPLADGRWLSSLGRFARKGYQWWPDRLFKKATAAAGSAGLVDACDFTIDTEEPKVARLNSAPTNIRAAKSTTSAIVAVGRDERRSRGIFRGSQKLAPLTLAMPFRGFEEGGRWTVDSISGTTWARVVFDGRDCFVAKALIAIGPPRGRGRGRG